MTRERYERLMGRFRGPHERLWILCFRRAPYVLALGYALLCLYVMFVRRDIAVRVIGVPAAVFALTSALRAAIDRPRPYDALGYTPLLPHRSRKGRSLPSRHAACAVVIACAMAYASAPLALPAGAMAATRPFSTRTSAGLTARFSTRLTREKIMLSPPGPSPPCAAARAAPRRSRARPRARPR